MTDSGSAESTLERSKEIRWNYAIVGAAIIGGVAYGILARGYQVDEPLSGGVVAWLPAAIVSVAMLVLGTVLVRVLRSPRTRTLAAAVAVAPATGGIILLEIFIAWAVSHLV
jgi:drug/metabolite transporter (DMT)-like permease